MPLRSKAQPGHAAAVKDTAPSLASRHRLAPARGVLLGLMIGGALWALLGLAALVWRGLAS